MLKNNKLLIAKNDEKELCILPSMANRHGIITGASGSGKTTTVKVMAESFSAAGVPVFYVDVKGDLATICKEGTPSESIDQRIKNLKLDDFSFQSFPVTFCCQCSTLYCVSVFASHNAVKIVFSYPKTKGICLFHCSKP